MRGLHPLAVPVDEAKLLRSWLERRSNATLLLVCIVLVAMVGVVDALTGKYLAFSLFYVLPISIAAWAGSRRLGILFSILCAAAWGSIDYQAGIGYPHYAYELWNTAIRLGFFLITTFLLSGLRAAYQRERMLARVDVLTGALNRRRLVEELEAALARARRDGSPISVGYCDLDDFKIVNDSRGHAAGDAVLREIARAALTTLGPGEALGRMGGDEFVVLLPGADATRARARGEALMKAWRSAMTSGGWPTSASLEIVTFDSIPTTADEVLHQADELSRSVKGRGKSGLACAVFPPEQVG